MTESQFFIMLVFQTTRSCRGPFPGVVFINIFWGRVSNSFSFLEDNLSCEQFSLGDIFLGVFRGRDSALVGTFLGDNFPRSFFWEAVFLWTVFLGVIFRGEGRNFRVFVIKWSVVSCFLCRKVDQNCNIAKHTLRDNTTIGS